MSEKMEAMGGYLGALDDVIKVEYEGGSGGGEWDHGVYSGIRNVYVTGNYPGVSHIMVEYDKDGKVEMHKNGDMKGERSYEGYQNKFVLDYPDEYITSVEGTCDLFPGRTNRVRSLRFKTSKGRMSRTYGTVGGKTFVLESKGRVLVGFHGRAGLAIDAIGAYFGPPPVHKLQGAGGDGGVTWDDGAFDGVRKIFVGKDQNGIASVKFVYDKNSQVVLGEDHGKKTELGYEEFELDYPAEYITAVEGYYERFGSESTVITMLKFNTNMRISPPFGFKSTSYFVLGKECYKVVGFHGKSSHGLHQFGVSVAVILASDKLQQQAKKEDLHFQRLNKEDLLFQRFNKEELYLQLFSKEDLHLQRVNTEDLHILDCLKMALENPHLSDCLGVTLHRFFATPVLKMLFSETSFGILLVRLIEVLLTKTEVAADADQKAAIVSGFHDALFKAENVLEDILLAASDQETDSLSKESKLWKFDKYLENLKLIVEDLDYYAIELNFYTYNWGEAVEAQGKPRSHMSPLFPERVIGREADKLAFANMLLSDEIVSFGTPSVISVNGMPGIGKTTLVKTVYDEESMTRHFDFKVWIYIGPDFDLFRVTAAVFHNITSAASKTEDLPSLQVQLKETLAGKRFLLVLDDFWCESGSEWKLFLTAFIGGSEGSKIVLTTQSDTVTSITQAAQTYNLRLMTKTECWELIYSSVFGYKPVSSMNQELEKVGKRIAEQCKGLPLVATTIASHLQSKPDYKEWYDVSNKFSHYTTGVVEVLNRSYDYLPCHLQRCFAFCSIFPKGYLIDRKNLVLLWMASDLLYQPGSNQSLEDIGNKYLDDLVARSFLQPTEYKKKFTMHDLMNDLAKTAAGDFCFRVEDDCLVQIPKRVRHLSICGKLGDSSIASYFTRGNEYLRTFLPIVVPPSSESSELAEKALMPLPNFSTRALSTLRILSLSHYHLTELPTSFKGLIKQLRYLDLSNTEVEEIPEFVFTLHNLQTLFLSNCRQLSRLTEKIEQLSNLRYLDLLWTPLVEMPRGISNLRSLQKLSNFVIGKLSGAGLQELRELSHLRGKLHISELQNVVSHTEDSDPGLKEKSLLKKLVLTWSVESSSSNAIACDQSEVLKMLQPHHNLEKISINSYGGETFPHWLGDISYISMTSVSLTSCSLCISLPPLGQLPYLRQVKIEKFEILQKVGLEFFYGENKNVSPLEPFPYLQSLTFSDMPRWEEWCCPELEGGIFPCLDKLTIRSCHSLAKKFPKGLPKLTQVTISDSPLKCEEDIGKLSEPESSSQNYEDIGVPSAPSQEHLTYSLTTSSNDSGSTSGMPQQDKEKENFIVETVHELMKLPASLKRLHIEGCPELKSLPKSLMLDCPNLQELLLVECHSLEAFPGGYPFTSLQTLYIRDCMKLEFMDRLHEVHIFPHLEDLFISNSCSTLCSFQLDLFLNLISLSIGDCENLSSFTVNFSRGDVCLALEALKITNCPNLESFPKRGLETPKLTSMLFSNCRNLKMLPAYLKNLTSLLSIHVNKCPELEGIPSGGFPKSLRTLCISHCQKLRLTVEWGLSYLDNLRDLEIDGGNDDTESFPDKELLPRRLYSLRISKFKNLRTLDHKGLEDLPTLAILEISECDKLASLSDKSLPSSLSLLRINGSPLLKEKISRRDMEWFNIKHIQLVEIDGEELPRRRKRT